VATYLLQGDFPMRHTTGNTPAARPTILVSVPRARPGYDTSRMAYVRTRNEIEYYAENRWVDTPSRMIAPLIGQALEATGAFASVTRAPSSVHSQWRLDTEIVMLQQDFETKPSREEFAVHVQLVDSRTQQVIASKDFRTTVAAPSEDARGGADAANQAVPPVLAQMAQWAGGLASRPELQR
jgi:cholesterol transport system auxiliary component